MSGTEENNSAGETAGEEEAIPSTSTRIVQTTDDGQIIPVAATGDIMEIIQQRPDCRVNVHLNVENMQIRGQNVQVGDQCTMPPPGTTVSHCLERHYQFQIRRCGDETCCAPAGTKTCSWLPDPVADQTGQHYKPFETLLGKDTDETDRPSSKGQTVAAVVQEQQGCKNSMLVSQNVRCTLECTECTKPRCIYSKLKLTTRYQRALKHTMEKYDYSCGSVITPDGSDSSEKLKKLLGEADLELKAYREHEGAVFIESPAFKACREKLEMGVVTIVGASGDGKTTIAKELLLRQTKRRAVIIADKEDWKEVDLAQNENFIILFDDMLGKFVSDSYKYWKTKLDKIFDAVRSGKIQVVITCRETVLSRCREEIQDFELFKPENRVHLSGPNSTCNLDTDTKRKMIQKLIDSTSNISICDKLDDENLSGDERKISLKSLEQIALKNCPGFPQCCYTFVSMPACFTRGDKFFDNPTEYLIKEIDRMRISDDKIDQFNYCTLVCVLFYGTLTVDTVEQEIEKIKLIANSCGIMITTTLPTEMQKAATRLSTSYLVGSRDKGFTFQHNSLLETIFTSFFESQPKLLIEHCAFNLIQSLVTTEQATEKSDLFCKIQGGTQTDSLCSRLATEIMVSNIKQAVGHRTLTDPVFVSKFFSHINTSSNKKTVLQSTEDNKSILYCAAGVSDTCFVEKLLTEMKSVMFVFRKARMGKKMSRALCGACRYGNYGVFTLLMSRPGVKVTDDCLCKAANGGDDRIVTDLLSVRKWSTHDVTWALYEACLCGRYDVYRSLITHNVTAIDGGCLCCAASGGDDRIVTELLSVRKWSTHHITRALYGACSRGRYDTYRLLITHNVTAIDDDCLCKAASGGDDRIVTELLSVRKWSTHDVTLALYWACIRGSYDTYRLLITHNVTAIDCDCLRCAVSGGDTKIKDDLLSKGYKLPDSDTD